MTQDEIIEMATQAGFVEYELDEFYSEFCDGVHFDDLEAFAKLVAAKERNFCSRCGKRTADLTTIHTCTPPHD
jgi:homoaconitase/3-isopropylmalate dehydratase large subunit